jgi:hypothetical protein
LGMTGLYARRTESPHPPRRPDEAEERVIVMSLADARDGVGPTEEPVPLVRLDPHRILDEILKPTGGVILDPDVGLVAGSVRSGQGLLELPCPLTRLSLHIMPVSVQGVGCLPALRSSV